MKEAKTPAQPAVDVPAARPTRRRFLAWLWTGLGLAALAEICWVGVSFLLAREKRNARSRVSRIVDAGAVEGFAPGTVTAIPKGQCYLARLADGGFLAMSHSCTHLGCSVRWEAEKNKFLCPCHGSSFSLTGEVLTAPAPRPLDYYPVRIENGVVKVDVAAPRRRERFEPEQATRL